MVVPLGVLLEEAPVASTQTAPWGALEGGQAGGGPATRRPVTGSMMAPATPLAQVTLAKLVRHFALNV